ncbi:MAG: hypothetical protein A3J97_01010 [Spirochaetes bacterium RIFOXYC1_FULL_54_7]|nr:MAG: hypothetical protein A3J97_01010 [Spirochaetes bacterium RIFOXYC1_FULL_54_7]
METSISFLESRLSAIPMPARQLYLLASSLLLGRSRDDSFIVAYAAALSDLDAADKADRGYVQIMGTCMEAFSLVSATRRGGHMALQAKS